MVTNIHNSSGKAKHLAASSLASMNLGALSLRQFGETVNWSNAESYQPKSRTPWAYLSTEASESVASVGSLESAAEVATPTLEVENTKAEIEAVENEKAAEDAAIQAEAARVAAEEAKAKAVAEEAATRMAAAEAQATMAQELAAKAAAEQQAAEKERIEKERKVAELAAAQEQAQADKKAADQRALSEAAEAERVANADNADKEAAETLAIAQAKQAESQAAAETLAAAEKAQQEELRNETAKQERLQLEQLQRERLRQESLQRDATAIQNTPLEAEKHSTNVPSKRIPPNGSNTTPPVSILPIRNLPAATSNQAVATSAVKSHLATRQESSTDEYLAQLERLVLELNMELGRRRDDQQVADPMQQLSQRIIELNLENLALKEQLQRSGKPT